MNVVNRLKRNLVKYVPNVDTKMVCIQLTEFLIGRIYETFQRITDHVYIIHYIPGTDL